VPGFWCLDFSALKKGSSLFFNGELARNGTGRVDSLTGKEGKTEGSLSPGLLKVKE